MGVKWLWKISEDDFKIDFFEDPTTYHCPYYIQILLYCIIQINISHLLVYNACYCNFHFQNVDQYNSCKNHCAKNQSKYLENQTMLWYRCWIVEKLVEIFSGLCIHVTTYHPTYRRKLSSRCNFRQGYWVRNKFSGKHQSTLQQNLYFW